MSSPTPVVLVTGSSRGLGRGIAETLAEAGFSVAINYATNKQAAEDAAEACRNLATSPAQKFALVGGNIGLAADRQRMFDETLAAYGHIDALVNNAGVAPRVRADITEATEKIFDEVIGVNLKGPYFLAQLAARYWLANPGKCHLPGGYKLIFVSSLSANVASINRGEYCISKAGLGMATQLWAVRLADAGVIDECIEMAVCREGLVEEALAVGSKSDVSAHDRKFLGRGSREIAAGLGGVFRSLFVRGVVDGDGKAGFGERFSYPAAQSAGGTSDKNDGSGG